MTEQEPTGWRTRWWRRLVGEVDGIGWWTLPAFLAVGLAGAVMAGALAIVYYSQQVSALENQTREARVNLEAAVDAVERAGDQALAQIEEQVAAVEDVLTQRVPVDDVNALGLVVIEARVNSPPPPSATVTPQPPPPAGETTPSGAVLAQPTDPATGPPTSSPSPSPSPTPTPPPIVPRLGVGFTVANEGGATFLATSFDLVADQNARAGVVEQVVVTTLDGRQLTGVVHSWDAGRGLALVRVPETGLTVGPWRPRADPVGPGDRVTIVGLTPRREPVQVEGTVGQSAAEAIVTSLPAIDFLRGAPIVDRTGRIVAVYTPEYRPFGPAAGNGQASAPAALLCASMLNGCDALEREAPTDEPS